MYIMNELTMHVLMSYIFMYAGRVPIFGECLLCSCADNVLCAEFSMCNLQICVCPSCIFEFVLCTYFSLCHVQFAATNLVARLRASLASLGSAEFLLCAVFNVYYVQHLGIPRGARP